MVERSVFLTDWNSMANLQRYQALLLFLAMITAIIKTVMLGCASFLKKRILSGPRSP